MLLRALQVAIWTVVFIQAVSGNGLLSVRFISFLNPTGVLDDGTCCDYRCGKCDHKFTVCFDRNTTFGVEDVNRCSYDLYKTGSTSDSNTVEFGNTVGGKKNPFIFRFSGPFKGEGQLKVDVWDNDILANPDDFVGFFTRTIRITSVETQNITLAYKTLRLNINVSLVCDMNMYGPRCEKLCVARNSDSRGHYTCNRQTGAKECLPGYTGSRCVDRICPDGFTGPDCQTPAACEPNPCQNAGVCYPDGMSYGCNCEGTGFTGDVCEEAA